MRNDLRVSGATRRRDVKSTVVQFAGGPWDDDEFQGRTLPKELRRKGWDGFYRLNEKHGFYQYFTVKTCEQCEGEGSYRVQTGERRCPGLGGSYEPVSRVTRCEECGGTGRVEIADD